MGRRENFVHPTRLQISGRVGLSLSPYNAYALHTQDMNAVCRNVRTRTRRATLSISSPGVTGGRGEGEGPSLWSVNAMPAGKVGLSRRRWADRRSGLIV